MTNQNGRTGELNFVQIALFIWKYRLRIIIACVATGILAYIFSSPWIITPKYRSKCVIYPAKTNTISRSLLGQVAEQQDVLAFGTEEESDRLAQILESDAMLNAIDKRFNLIKHYGLENDKLKRTKLKSYFREDVKIIRTEYLSLEINVMNTDKVLAANIANAMIDELDSIRSNIQTERAKEVLRIIEKRYKEKQQFVQELKDSLAKIGGEGVLDYEKQSGVVTEQYALAKGRGNNIVAGEMKQLIDKIGKYGPTQISLAAQIKNGTYSLSDLEGKLAQAKADVEQKLSFRFVIDRAVPAEKKAYPLRIIIVILTMIGTFFTALIYLAFLDNWKASKKKLSEQSAS